jgi:FtsH-binding integral membrane protein
LLLNFSTEFLLTVIVGGSIVLMMLATWFLRRHFPERIHAANNEVAGFIFAAVAVFYGVMLAFVVVVVWQSYDTARAIVSREANAVMDLYRFSWELPAPYDAALRSAVKDYTQTLIQDEWAAMARGQGSVRTDKALDAVWAVHRDLHLANAVPSAQASNFFNNLAAVGNERRLRLNENETELPILFWLLLVGGGAITLGFTLFFRAPNARAHYLMVIMMTGVVAFVLFLIMELDDPFVGSISVSPAPFERVLTTIQQFESP